MTWRASNQRAETRIRTPSSEQKHGPFAICHREPRVTKDNTFVVIAYSTRRKGDRNVFVEHEVSKRKWQEIPRGGKSSVRGDWFAPVLGLLPATRTGAGPKHRGWERLWHLSRASRRLKCVLWPDWGHL